MIQNELNPRQRATMDSIISLACGVVPGTSLYLVGLIADYTSIYWGFGILIMGKLVLGFLYSRLGKKYED